MLANLVNTAATLAGQDGRDEICNIDMFKALEEERLGPLRATPYSADARRRLAVMEAATSLACTLLPAIEPVTSVGGVLGRVTIVPREKYPLGQTVLRANEDREITGLYTRRYLQEQLLTVLAGRAAGEAGGARVGGLVELLLEKDSLTGEVVRAVAEQLGHPDDLAARAAVAGAFL
eukprot:scaffold9.g3039.t1